MSSPKKKTTKTKKSQKDYPVSTSKNYPREEFNDDVITPEIAEVIKELPEEQRKTVVRALIFRRNHSGPLPDGETIKIYSEVIPNGGDRLMTTVEKQLEHRIEIEKEGLQKTYKQSGRGQIFGFIIAIIFGVIAWDLGRRGEVVIASILGAVDLVALVTVFITGQARK
ncbi:MAG: DUF2335 domain-containing protein [Flavobacteriaceae bacterium]|nr:DUF2335 domain-containing protein [Flavobacteriaceae bacterium]